MAMEAVRRTGEIGVELAWMPQVGMARYVHVGNTIAAGENPATREQVSPILLARQVLLARTLHECSVAGGRFQCCRG